MKKESLEKIKELLERLGRDEYPKTEAVDSLLAEVTEELSTIVHEPEFEGTPIKFGRRTIIIPPLNLKRLKKLLPEIQKLQAGTPMTNEDEERIVKVVHSAIQRNYPEMTEEEVEEIVDLGNSMTVVKAIMGISGLQMKSGEIQAGR